MILGYLIGGKTAGLLAAAAALTAGYGPGLAFLTYCTAGMIAVIGIAACKLVWTGDPQPAHAGPRHHPAR